MQSDKETKQDVVESGSRSAISSATSNAINSAVHRENASSVSTDSVPLRDSIVSTKPDSSIDSTNQYPESLNTTVFEGSPYLDPDKKRRDSQRFGDLTITLSPMRRTWLFLAFLLAFLAIVLAPLQFDNLNLGSQYLNVSKTDIDIPLSNSQQSIFEQSRNAALQIEVLGPSLSYRYVQGMGTGFFISDDGLILTAYHVIRSHKDSRFVAKDMAGRRYYLKLIAFDAHQDVALLKTEVGNPVPYLKLGSIKPRVGAHVMTIGNSRGDFLQARAGRVKRLNAKASRADFASDTIEFSAKLEAGDSGGPVLNAKGEVIGVVSYISFIPDDVLLQSKKLIPSPLRPLLLPPQISSFAVPMFRNSFLLEELLAGKKRDVPVIGIYGSDYVPGNAVDTLGGLKGALVDHVPENSPAYFSGLKSCQLKDEILFQQRQPAQVVGCLGLLTASSRSNDGRTNQDKGNLRSQAAIKSADVIVAIDGERTLNFVEVINKIRSYNIGDQVVLSVQRGDERVELVLLLGAEAHIFDQRF